MCNTKMVRCVALLGALVTNACSSEETAVTDATDAADVSDVSDASDAPEVDDSSCKLPEDGNASLRLGNLVPSLDRVDYCIKPSTQDSYAGIKPTLASWGGGCQRGLGYRDVTAKFRADAGVVDISIVEVDDNTDLATVCAETGVATLSQVNISEGATMSLLVFGDQLTSAVAKALPEFGSAPETFSALRFVHGLVGVGNLDGGISLLDFLPAELDLLVWADVPFGEAASQAKTPSGTVDTNGYLHVQVGGAQLNLGASLTGGKELIVLQPAKTDSDVSYTLFATGRMNDNEYPPGIYICDEQSADGILARCGTD